MRSISENSLACIREYGFAYGVANLFAAAARLEQLGKMPIYLGKKSSLKIYSNSNSSIDYDGSVKHLAKLALISLFEARRKLKECNRDIVPIIYCVATTGKTLSYVKRKPEMVRANKVCYSLFSKRVSLLVARVTKKL